MTVGVSVVVVDDGDPAALAVSLDGLAQCEWPGDDLEVVVVAPAGPPDVDRSVVRVVDAPQEELAAARNRGAAAATGTWLAFLGAGCEPDAAWLRAALDAADHDAGVACVASAVVGDDGVAVWSPLVSVTGQPMTGGRVDRSGDVLYASAEAMVVEAAAFADAGGFDERYGRLLDDVDLGWRLWLLGRRVVLVPTSRVRRPLTGERPDGAEERFLRDRNALFTIFKNYDDTSLSAAFPTAVLLGVHQAATDAAPRSALPIDLAVDSSARAVAALVDALPELRVARRRVQERRLRTDAELFRLLALPTGGSGSDATTPEAAVVEAFGVGSRFGRRRRIVVATCDALTPKMAGPAIRALQIAAALATEHDVQLVTTSLASVHDPRFPVRAVDDRELAELERWCDILIFQGWLVTGRPFLLESKKVLVADAYDPLHLEQLEQGRDGGDEARRRAVRNATEVLNEQLLRADFLLCASTKQRDFWLGQLSALGRVNPRTYDEDPNLESLIAVVPFGVSDAPPVTTRPAAKGVIPGIGPGDQLVLWGGGVYNWFDPLTLLRAVDRLRHTRPTVRLLFMGLRHPNPDIPEMRMAATTRALAAELALTGTHVFFNEDWVAFDDRQNFLLEADVGVTTHLAHLETALSSRTRILDYLWASLPVVATEGDVLADLVASRGLGITVPPNDVDALESALYRILDDEGFAKTCRQNIATVVPELEWSRVLAPLVEFCRRPRRAPDLLDPVIAGRLRRELTPAPVASGWRSDVRTGLDHLREGGPVRLASKAWSRARRRVS